MNFSPGETFRLLQTENGYVRVSVKVCGLVRNTLHEVQVPSSWEGFVIRKLNLDFYEVLFYQSEDRFTVYDGWMVKNT